MVLKRENRDGMHCDLCGCSEPAVRCEKCSQQIFCLSCDDMYHRHPKRRNHARKTVTASTDVKSPQKEAEACRLPIPPPRRRKSQKSVPSSPLFGRKTNDVPPLPKKEFSFMDKVGSLRRMMIGRPLPPVPKDEPPGRPAKNDLQQQMLRHQTSSCSSYSNVSGNDVHDRDRQSPAYANDPMNVEWENRSPSVQAAYPSSLTKSAPDATIQMGFQGFPTLPKRGVTMNDYPGRRMSTSSSVMDFTNNSMAVPGMGMGMQMPQTQSTQGLNYIPPNAPHPYMESYMNPYHVPLPPWMAPQQNYFMPYHPDQMKRTPSNSSINYPASETGYRMSSYTSMGHLHNPMAMAPYPPFVPPQRPRAVSPTHSTRSARSNKNQEAFARSSRRNTTHGYFPGRRSVMDNTSSEEDYFSASDEDELRAGRPPKSEMVNSWQCEHCTMINPKDTRICSACCKTTGHTTRSHHDRRRRRKDGGKKSPSSGDSRPSSTQQGQSKSPEDLVDEIAKDLINEMENNFSMKPNAPLEEKVKEEVKTESEAKNTRGSEPQRKTQVTSTGTSPPPQTISTQTNLSDDSPFEESPRPLYRTSSRSSLLGNERDVARKISSSATNNDWFHHRQTMNANKSLFGGGLSRDQSPSRNSLRGESDLSARNYSYEPINRTDYYLNLEELIERRRQEKMRSQGFELVRLLREAEQNNFTADDLQVAMNHCGNQNPIQWLHDNWKTMVDTVISLVNNFSRDKQENDIGVVSAVEAKESLRKTKGNVWAAVTDCVEVRQNKFAELRNRGDFNRNEVTAALTANQGNIEAAFIELSRNSMKPFQMKIWGPPVGVDNESGTVSMSYNARNQFENSGFSGKTNLAFEKSPKADWIESMTGGASGRRARIYLAEGTVTTYDQAEIVVQLIDRNFSEEDAHRAARECSDLEKAITYLQQECGICTETFPMWQMISMLNCTHRCCQSCARDHFTVLIRDRNIMEAVCPFCDEPDLNDDDVATEYFNNLDILLKNFVEIEIHELFQRKLRDRALMKDPNFHWCPQCSSGFIAPPRAKRLQCPDCNMETCAQCRKPWESQHAGISCEKFLEWKRENDPEYQAKGLERHLEENGIDCPKCKFRYSLAKGGCMHFRCLQCKYDFCSGCGKPFKIGPKCDFSPICIKLGLHAHHPRNCLFYLRDKEPEDLQKLLQQHGIQYDIEPPPSSAAAHTDRAIFKCQVMEQKEKPGEGLKDEVCGGDVQESHAGLCRKHYLEYLISLINKEGVDPVWIFDVNDLQQELRRREKVIPEQQRMTDEKFREFLIQMIQGQIPLDETIKKR